MPKNRLTQDEGGLCKSISRIDPRIVLVAWLKNDFSKESYVKEGLGVPNEKAQQILAIRAHLITQLVKESESYMGGLNYIKVSQHHGDVFLFHMTTFETLVVVIEPDKYDEIRIVRSILDLIKEAQHPL